MLWLLSLGFLGCDTRTRIITEGERTLYSEDLQREGRFVSGDPLLVGSSFCMGMDQEKQNACVRMDGLEAEPEYGFCFEFMDLGVAEVQIEPAACEESETDWEDSDRLRLDVIPVDGLSAQLVWPVEERAASLAQNASYEILGPDFAVAGVVPSVDTPLWIWPQAELPVHLSVHDAEADVAWSYPWQVEVEGAFAREDKVWSFSGPEGGRIAVVNGAGQERIEAREWSPADTVGAIEDRLHVAIFEWDRKDFDAAIDAGELPFPEISAFLESTGPAGQVVKGQPVEWGVSGVNGARVTGYLDPAAVEVDLFCAMSWRSRRERMVLHARSQKGRSEQAFWVRIPRLPRDPQSKENFKAYCDALQPDLSGCSQAPGRGLLLPGLLGLVGLLLRRKQD